MAATPSRRSCTRISNTSHRLAERLRTAIPGSTLRIVTGAGHMVHHVATDQVVEAILAVVGSSGLG